MARAIAICTCETCGTKFEVVRRDCYNRKAADDFERWAVEHICECSECEKKRIAAERAAQAKEMGWPELQGSPKQIAWAMGLRGDFYRYFRKNLEMYAAGSKPFKAADGTEISKNDVAIECLNELFAAHDKASWWIDNQCVTDIEGMIYKAARERVKALKDGSALVEKAALESEAEEEAKAEAATVAEPAEKKHEGIVDISVPEGCVIAAYQKDDTFREIVKGLGYSWSPSRTAWVFHAGVTDGTPEDRAAELGNRLLNAGFSVRIQDAETRRKAIEADYQPRTYRWVSRLGDNDAFIVSWKKEDDLYDKAKTLPRAKWDRDNRGMRVPADSWREVMDFARAYGFQYTPGAQALIEKQQASTVTVSPAAPKEPAYDEHPVSAVLDSSREVLPDLKDPA